MLKIHKYSGTFCAPCRALAPIIKEVAQEMGIEVVNFDADEHESQFAQNSVRSVPTLIFMKNNLEVRRETGMMTKDKLKGIIEELNK
jgi:thioredoxin 1